MNEYVYDEDLAYNVYCSVYGETPYQTVAASEHGVPLYSIALRYLESDPKKADEVRTRYQFNSADVGRVLFEAIARANDRFFGSFDEQ